jgi:hypothetical protein
VSRRTKREKNNNNNSNIINDQPRNKTGNVCARTTRAITLTGNENFLFSNVRKNMAEVPV